MTNEPKLAPAAPENASVAQPVAQPKSAPQNAPQEKAAPSTTTVNGAPETKKSI